MIFLRSCIDVHVDGYEPVEKLPPIKLSAVAVMLIAELA